MAIVRIRDLEDPRLIDYQNLKATNVTRDRGRFVVEGLKLVKKLLVSPFPTDSVLTTEKRADRVSAILPEGVPLFVVPDSLVDRLVGYEFHQGAIACGVRRPWPPLEEIIEGADSTITLLVCPRVENPENLGALIRLGDVFGASALLVGGHCPDPLSRRVVRVSAGTALQFPVLIFDDLESEIARFHVKHHLQLAAAVTDADALPFDQFQRSDRLALVLGSESAGLSKDWESRCDIRLTIPMRPGADSLNLSLAAGILLYHLTRP